MMNIAIESIPAAENEKNIAIEIIDEKQTLTYFFQLSVTREVALKWERRLAQISTYPNYMKHSE